MVKSRVAILGLLLINLIFVLPSCKKDESLHVDAVASAIRPPRPMIQTITITDYQGAVNWEHYYYDSVWRLIKLHRYNGYYSRMDTDNYVYDSINRGVAINNDWYSFNNGLVTSHSWNSETYSYNSNSDMISKTMLHGYIYYNYDADYNLESSHMNGEYGLSDRTNSDNSYFYNTHLNTIGNYNKGLYMWGKSSVNLPDYALNHDYLSSQGSNAGNFSFTLYSYQYNDSGWVSHQEVKNASLIKTYTDSVNYTVDTTYYLTKYDYTYY